MSTVVSFRADDALVAALDELARATHRDRPYHLRQALAQYLERQQWQVAAIDEGLADANAGRLLEHTEIEKRWGCNEPEVDPQGGRRPDAIYDHYVVLIGPEKL